MIVVGLMSGTSADGIDAAVVDIAGAPPYLTVRLLSHTAMPYEQEMRERIFALFQPATGTVDAICQMNFALGELFATAALGAIEEASLTPADVALIGSHGQTIYHAVGPDAPLKSTLQIGEAAVIAQRTAITTIADFRMRDVAAGGQGAPLVSFVDYFLFRHETLTRAVQNIGGIANVTVLPAGISAEEVLAFDTGPGNMLIDYAAGQATGGRWRCDHDGQLAAQGRVDEDLLKELMAHPFLCQPPPKTTGREEFGVQFGQEVWERGRAQGLSAEDVVSTVTAFTAATIAQAYRDFIPYQVDQVILGGGGSRNPTLVKMLQEWLAPAEVLLHEDLGFSSDAKEAMAFAVLAYETWHNRPGNLPSCTGASRPVVLGKIVPGDNYRALLEGKYPDGANHRRTQSGHHGH